MKETWFVFVRHVTTLKVAKYTGTYKMKIIKNYINGWYQTIQDKIALAIYTIGENRKLKKQERLQKKINKAIKKVNLVIKPQEHVDTLVVINGAVVRVQFTPEGFIIRNDITNEDITDQLFILRVLERIKQ